MVVASRESQPVTRVTVPAILSISFLWSEDNRGCQPARLHPNSARSAIPPQPPCSPTARLEGLSHEMLHASLIQPSLKALSLERTTREFQINKRLPPDRIQSFRQNRRRPRISCVMGPNLHLLEQQAPPYSGHCRLERGDTAFGVSESAGSNPPRQRGLRGERDFSVLIFSPPAVTP